MKEIYISVIVPVYNAEKYLRECIESIVNQYESFSDFELILVDDGSTDGSLNICLEYEKEYGLTVISQENKGPAVARNNGLKKATGKYILFIDSDDYIEAHSIKKIVELCEKQKEPDIFFLNGSKVYHDGREVIIEEDFDIKQLIENNRDQIFEYLSQRAKFQASPCLKMIKREILIDNNIIFEPGRRVEDLDWSMKCFMHSKTFGAYNDVYYYYRQGIETSNSANFQDDSYRDFKYVINNWIKLAQNEIGSVKGFLLNSACYEYIILLANCKDYIKSDLQWHNDMNKLLDYRNDKMTKLVRICTRTIGIKNTSRLLNLYLQIR